MSESVLLEGRVAIVTGAAHGIGRGIALALAEQGAHVVVHYNASKERAEDVRRALEALGVRAAAVRADLRQVSAAQQIVAAAQDAFGGVDILVNNAGVFSGKPALEISPEDWQRVHMINLQSPFLLCQAAARVMQAGRGGVMLNIASGGGLSPHPAYATGAHYATAKAGLVMLTKRLAHEWAPEIRVNCIAPGVVDSKPTPLPESWKRKVMPHVPLNRIGSVEDIAQAAVFLCSDRSGYMTGQVINVDGGILMS